MPGGGWRTLTTFLSSAASAKREPTPERWRRWAVSCWPNLGIGHNVKTSQTGDLPSARLARTKVKDSTAGSFRGFGRSERDDAVFLDEEFDVGRVPTAGAKGEDLAARVLVARLVFVEAGEEGEDVELHVSAAGLGHPLVPVGVGLGEGLGIGFGGIEDHMEAIDGFAAFIARFPVLVHGVGFPTGLGELGIE